MVSVDGFLVQTPQQGGELGGVDREDEWLKSRLEWKGNKGVLEGESQL